jgi:uncharacterized protein YceH (UPF0502 family)
MTLDIRLDPNEARVFGVLVEKALTTPEQYPLTINAATNGANQKSNRDPVLSLSEDEVASALERLEQKYMARKVFPMNSRVEKFCHNGKDALNLDAAGTAVLAELLMRGPQTPGDLRARASRMASIDTLDQLASILAMLIERGYVQRLDPLPGSRAERYVQLLSPDLHPLEPPAGAYVASSSHAQRPAVSASPELVERVAALEAEVARLKEQLRALVDKLA